ncbi:ATP-dependent helicase/deoxyribonuclease subunit B [Acetatifactor muris]|uniref:ATP-dependent helicase/deoxyribonuclease subunit B n=1 Tax=Acetatifactor muris TaxID=879566 RepID=A0A2K4ZHD7_9FIRM|nr:helicase-exonuclease AddAB subunit AddB [Acetatifactor muris]SOY29893.1 ATP-dependent helicase/deoxyribonuclease subunit B [Acetatifactor muris]
MSLQFYFGPSGSGKSRSLYEEITGRAKENPKQNFLIIVPDQFTMQTQKELVLLNDGGGIMNIDVLSFGRLGHRILEEVGGREIPVLDDTGKSLVLQKVAANLKEELPALGGFLHRQGYIHEVKSAISEFMQYGIGTEDVARLIAFAEKRGALVQKLRDLETLYRGFVEYIHGNFVTTEETLDVLRRSLHKSELLPGAVVAFDGFTGFTPVQVKVIAELMRLCGEVIVTLTMGAEENPYGQDSEQKLFHLSKKTAMDLAGIAKENLTERKQDVFILPGDRKNSVSPGGNGFRIQYNDNHRFRSAPALKYLENHLFRYGTGSYEKEQQEIRMFETTGPKDEVHHTGLEICRLIREEGLAYRDIALIMGDLAEYAPYVETEFAQMEIPCYIDRTRGIVLNPMIEYIKSALELYIRDFSYEAVFCYLRSGLAGLTWEEVDRLENYCLQTGIRGYRAYSRLFTRKTPEMEEDEEALAEMNRLRERLMVQVEMLHLREEEKTKVYVNALYDFLVQNQVQQKLAVFQNAFEEAGDLTRAKEYAQIYRLVMELLDQIYTLLGEENIPLKEFAEILEAGFGEIQVGTIPQNVDRVLVGDMERTRLNQVRVLFFLGVNDGNIPKAASRGGIISDMDREFLRESELELAPSPRQQMYIQRFYLYLNMTKPSERLYLSWSKVNSAGKSIRPAYLVEMIRKLYPGITVQYPQMSSVMEQIVTRQEGASYLAEELREYADGTLQKERETEFFTIYRVYGEAGLREKRDFLAKAAFRRYEDTGLSAAVARALYGVQLENSVTRLETYAACAYRHFLQYGLALRERGEFSFETVDMGNVYHAILEQFGEKLKENNYTWFDFPEEFAAGCVREVLENYAATYRNTVLYSSARNEYAVTRMGRILTRTVLTLQKQLQKGSFVPESFELSFQYADNLESVNVALTERERMRLQGRIDRIDVAEDGEKVYVKVIDYKSGNKKFDLAALYYGLQLQLVVYMNAAVEMEARRHKGKEIVPAALLYYHIDDPSVETAVELSPEEINREITRQLRMNGVVNSAPEIVELLDHVMEDKSDVIPVERKKDGSLSSRSSVLSGRELKTVSDYVSRKIVRIGREILDGQISLNPYEKGSEEACTYCAFKRVCGFEPALPGCEKRRLEDMNREEVLRRMEDTNQA